jgi:hypothetical protein
MFRGHEGPCAPCGGIGLVLQDGSLLPPDEIARVVRVYRQMLRTRDSQLKRLQAQLDALQPPAPKKTPDDILRDAVYPPGSRYHGD